jgi:hypothetical protein
MNSFENEKGRTGLPVRPVQAPECSFRAYILSAKVLRRMSDVI